MNFRTNGYIWENFFLRQEGFKRISHVWGVSEHSIGLARLLSRREVKLGEGSGGGWRSVGVFETSGWET